ncbi:arsenite methyltransferase [Clostridium thermarum]|uniref:arsenite methyltransferase n=1 Tax=Clostridium thermarum TaxID=1716543 RepID=UPI001123246C|nr:arsenite methyltransferase [Clostridium thermarum]
MSNNKEEIRVYIRKKYSKVAKLKESGTGCCGTGGCCCGDSSVSDSSIQEAAERLGYNTEELNNIPEGSNMGLGCGNPIAIASLKEGETVLDLGSGGGIDCFLALSKVGQTGHVIGVDMTPEMIELSRKNVAEEGCKNLEFRLGEIEHLPVADNSVDVIISNCVINLSLDKRQVFSEAYRVLKKGGRISISDVAATAEIPEEMKNDLSAVAGCIAGAEHIDNIRKMLSEVGFNNIRLTEKANSREILNSWIPGRNLDKFVASFYIEAQKD